jgi:hypothetical protein
MPKNNMNIDIFLEKKNGPIRPYISYSLIYHLNDIYTNLLKLENPETIEYINKIVNPYEFIHTNIPGFTISVSKVKSESNIFFELMEIFQICNIVETLYVNVKNRFNVLQLSPNYVSSDCLLSMFLKHDLINTNNNVSEKYDFNYNDIIRKFVIENSLVTKFNFMFFEFNECDYTDMKQYIKNMLLILLMMIKYQGSNGISIIKIDGIFYKIIIDIILIFTAIYDKVYLIKPIISNITKGDRYIVCKYLNHTKISETKLFTQLEEQIQDYLVKLDDTSDIVPCSLIKNEIPYYFLNKIEESNSVIGQQQLETYDQVINIFKNKNKDDKMESLKKSHIQKCIQWCEKNQLPHNKFTDKVNMFLNP